MSVDATTHDATADRTIAARLRTVRRRIEAACDRAGRRASAVVLIGVTKTHPPSVARTLVTAGVGDLGEARVGELLAKAPHVPDARWHLVGRLQSRKARDVIGEAVLVHSVDRHSLIDELSRRAESAGVVQRILVQVNVGDDPAKGGCEVDGTLDLVAYARSRPNLAVEGLMTMPPLPPDDADPVEAARPHFALLRRLRDEARERWPEVTHLSMGMSADLEAAVEEGATMVRVGTALVGPRRPHAWEPGRSGSGAVARPEGDPR
ncbi:MAG: YggS family pyridoxal phosphate-dependent enzyme [Actinobacteria bacterium]|nr:YggS family pyridoxal phosphate-dependent enzyme [Actinomycetota bacterium]